MIIPPRTILSCCIVGDALHVARVRIGPMGASVLATATLEAFLEMSPADRKDALGAIRAGASRLVLVTPSDWCAVRPIAITTKGWKSAKPELIQSIDRLVPMTADDAMVGLLNLYADDLAPKEGRLIAMRRAVAEPWMHAIEDAAGASITMTLSPHMAMLGLGVQREDHTDIIEVLDADDLVRHEMHQGLPVQMGGAVDGDLAPDALLLPHHTSLKHERTATGVNLAVAGAVAPYVAPHAFAPMQGSLPSQGSSWLAPIGALAAAAALLLASPFIYDARLERGIESLRAEQAALTEPFQEAQALRARTERLASLLLEGVRDTTATWRPALPALAESQNALSGEGFLYRIVLDTRGVTISGESDDAGAVLRALEESPLLTSARRTGPLMPSPENGWSIFEMRAERGETP